MKPQVQPNRWSCLVTSFAIVLDLEVSELINDIGHDGSEIFWPLASFPLDRRSFHEQELIDCCLQRGYSVTTIQPRPSLASPEHLAIKKEGLICEREITLKRDMHSRLLWVLNDHTCVLKGLGLGGTRHAVAWGDNMCIDPANGSEIPIEYFSIESVFLIDKLTF